MDQDADPSFLLQWFVNTITPRSVSMTTSMFFLPSTISTLAQDIRHHELINLGLPADKIQAWGKEVSMKSVTLHLDVVKYSWKTQLFPNHGGLNGVKIGDAPQKNNANCWAPWLIERPQHKSNRAWKYGMLLQSNPNWAILWPIAWKDWKLLSFIIGWVFTGALLIELGPSFIFSRDNRTLVAFFRPRPLGNRRPLTPEHFANPFKHSNWKMLGKVFGTQRCQKSTLKSYT